MSDPINSGRKERFTMLEPKGPNTAPPESEAWPVVELFIQERFTMLEPKGPNNPPPDEMSALIVEPLINGDPVRSEPLVAVPPAVQSLLAQLATVIATLDANGRAAALDYISNEFTKRLAG